MTYIIILITVIISIYANRNKFIFEKYKFNAYLTYHKKQWYRLVSHGFLHSTNSYDHLIFNMLSLFFFGPVLEVYLNSHLLFAVLYLSSIVIASLSSLYKHKDNYYYNSIGASGGVSAIIFACIFFDPMSSIYIMFIPIPVPGFIYGIAYLVYSQYMSRKNSDNVNHDAHFLGAVYGFIFPLITGAATILDFINHF